MRQDDDDEAGDGARRGMVATARWEDGEESQGEALPTIDH